MTPGLLESESCSGGRKGKPPMGGPRAQREGERGRRGDRLGRREVFWATELGRRERKKKRGRGEKSWPKGEREKSLALKRKGFTFFK